MDGHKYKLSVKDIPHASRAEFILTKLIDNFIFLTRETPKRKSFYFLVAHTAELPFCRVSALWAIKV